MRYLVIFLLFTGLAMGKESVIIGNNVSVGDEFVYAENKTTTIVDLFTGETNVTLVETICTHRIVELENDATGLTGEVEKFCTWARFTPPNDREQRRLLFDRSRLNLGQIINPPLNFKVGDSGSENMARLGALFGEITGHNIVTRIYYNEEYETEVVTIETDAPCTVDILGMEIPAYAHRKREIDTNTGATVLLETTSYSRTLTHRETQVTVKKLVKPKPVYQDL